MVYACAYWATKNNSIINKYFKFDDSKKLTPQKRETLFEEMKKYPNIFGYEIVEASPEYLSQKMLQREKYSLNQIAYDCASELLIRTLRKGVNLKKIYVDTIGTESKYKAHLQGQIKSFPNRESREIIVEKKADAKYKSVSAGSIVAKVTRDRIIEGWTYKEVGEVFTKNTGSGYPSDPNTKQWLEKNFDDVFGYPSFVRFSWKTIDEIFKKKEKDCVWENYDEEEEKRKEKEKYKKNKSGYQTEITYVKKEKPKGFYEKYNMDFEVDL
ncbi:MAG: ribonuclease HII [archaeon]|nr:ribonuclease HII [archaeon]